MEREPLPYPHERGEFDRGFPAACTHPESEDVAVYRGYDTCPGCRAYAAATLARNPNATGHSTSNDRRVSLLEGFRRLVPDYDPIRVLLERHLARD